MLRNNFVYHNTSVGIAIGGYDTRRGSTKHCVIVNNTLFGNDYRQEGNGELLVQFDTRNNVIKNNIFSANRLLPNRRTYLPIIPPVGGPG